MGKLDGKTVLLTDEIAKAVVFLASYDSI